MSEPTPIQRMARVAAERSAREQGLPAKITDGRVVEQVATILGTGNMERKAA